MDTSRIESSRCWITGNYSVCVSLYVSVYKWNMYNQSWRPTLGVVSFAFKTHICHLYRFTFFLIIIIIIIVVDWFFWSSSSPPSRGKTCAILSDGAFKVCIFISSLVAGKFWRKYTWEGEKGDRNSLAAFSLTISKYQAKKDRDRPRRAFIPFFHSKQL